MSGERLLDTQPSLTPGLHQSHGLPDDLLRDAARRLSFACWLWAAIWGAGFLANNFVTPFLDLPQMNVIPWEGPANIVALSAVAISLGLGYYARQLWCDCARVLDLALYYEVALAFGLGLVNQWTPLVLVGRLSWICVLILIFPMIVPNTWRKTLIASLVAASMDPLGLAVAALRGVELPSASLLFWGYLPNYVCAVLAVIPSHVVRRLGRQVREARELGSYRLGERIGQGGMGEVWRATHRLLARPAAVKLIKPDVLGGEERTGSTSVIERFRREAQAAAFLQSPHTIRLYDFGVTREGTFYIVMELLDGLDLEMLVRRHGFLPPERVAHVLRQVCHSLAEAHQRGIVHRDVKPANIYLCRVGLDLDFVKVLDFGLVKWDHDQGVMDTMRRASELTTGTPAYMAPEMAAGDEVDHRADIYALGCVGYWLLTGQLVFTADTAVKMLLQHIQAEPIPPSVRASQPIPAALDALIMSCLAKDPADRPQNAEEVVRRLEEWAPVAAWNQSRAGEWWGEHESRAESRLVPETATV